MTRRTAKAKTKRESRPLSRPLLNKLLRDLVERADRQVEVAEAIATTNTPNSQHTVKEIQLRTVFGLLLSTQLEGLRDVAGFARLIHDRSGSAAP
jgi:hypothetical protein